MVLVCAHAVDNGEGKAAALCLVPAGQGTLTADIT